MVSLTTGVMEAAMEELTDLAATELKASVTMRVMEEATQELTVLAATLVPGDMA